MGTRLTVVETVWDLTSLLHGIGANIIGGKLKAFIFAKKVMVQILTKFMPLWPTHDALPLLISGKTQQVEMLTNIGFKGITTLWLTMVVTFLIITLNQVIAVATMAGGIKKKQEGNDA